MKGLRLVRRGALAWAACAIGGCTETASVQRRIDSASAVAREADANGAYACAPREFAIARAHLRFAAAALRRGQSDAALDHLAVAEPNARAARSESPPATCKEPARLARARDGAGLGPTGLAQDDEPR